MAALQADFKLDLIDARGRKRRLQPEVVDLKKCRRRLRIAERNAKKQENDFAEKLGAKVGGRLRRVWLLRVGLSDPRISGQTLSEFCRDFTGEETKQISKD